jgi:hypothetical protein
MSPVEQFPYGCPDCKPSSYSKRFTGGNHEVKHVRKSLLQRILFRLHLADTYNIITTEIVANEESIPNWSLHPITVNVPDPPSKLEVTCPNCHERWNVQKEPTIHPHGTLWHRIRDTSVWSTSWEIGLCNKCNSYNTLYKIVAEDTIPRCRKCGLY